MALDDTIAAIATPLGEGGLAVIRLSGAAALAVADRCFAPAGKSSLKPSLAATHTIQYGHVARNGQRIDEVLVAVMRAPRSFTREDVVEISCHGSPFVQQQVIEACIRNGARLAKPEAGQEQRQPAQHWSVWCYSPNSPTQPVEGVVS